MNQKELKELIEFIIEKGIAEFELERGDVKVKIKRASEAPPVVLPDSRYIAVHPAPVAAAAAAPVPASAPPTADLAAAVTPVPEPEEDLHIVRSPIVGTFYEAPTPGAPPFVKVGDPVEVGQVLCIVEAMKLMNEIEAEVSGEIVKIYVENAESVEFGQALFGIRASRKS